MISYQFGDIVLISFPFTDTAKQKNRPASVLADTGDKDIVVCRITSHSRQSKFDINIKNWKSSGLLLSSLIRVNKIATIEKKLIYKILGRLSNYDIKNLKYKLNELLNLGNP